MVGASVTKTIQMFGISRGTVSKVMIAFEKKKENVSAKYNSGRKPKLSERDRQNLYRIVRKHRRTTVLKITSEINEHLRTIFPQKLSVESCTKIS